MIALTARQWEVLVFINGFRATEQCNPTCDEIATHFGWASANAASDHLAALKKKGVIRSREGARSRGYKVRWDFMGPTEQQPLQSVAP